MGRKKGLHEFTLVELLVVVSVIAIISGMVLTMMSRSTAKSAKIASVATQKELTNAVANYWQARGAPRTRYSPGTRLAVRFADLPAVQDRWQEAHSVSVEMAQNRTSAIE